MILIAAGALVIVEHPEDHTLHLLFQEEKSSSRRGKYSMLGGDQKAGETLIETAKREVVEESGKVFKPDEILVFLQGGKPLEDSRTFLFQIESKHYVAWQKNRQYFSNRESYNHVFVPVAAFLRAVKVLAEKEPKGEYLFKDEQERIRVSKEVLNLDAECKALKHPKQFLCLYMEEMLESVIIPRPNETFAQKLLKKLPKMFYNR